MAAAPLDRRLPLAHLPTPLVALDRLGAELGMPAGRLFAKLDDATGLAAGGNKVRKLEYLCAEAVAQGCDTLVTGGGAQSNHARLTAAAARRLGLECTLVLGGEPPATLTGNLVLDHVLGTELRWVAAYEYHAVERAIADAAADLAAAAVLRADRGSTPLGALGYVRTPSNPRPGAAHQLVVIASGSGGTTPARRRPGRASPRPRRRCRHARGRGARAEQRPHRRARRAPPPASEAQVDPTQIGAGYRQTDACREAITMAARLEPGAGPGLHRQGLAGLIAAQRANRLAAGTRIVFVHTGGLPALFTPSAAAWPTT
jgi:D-cysteine desulfhydrase